MVGGQGLNVFRWVWECPVAGRTRWPTARPRVTRLALRELAQRVAHLDDQLARAKKRLTRITTAAAPELVPTKGVGPDVASTLLITAGDNPHRHTPSGSSLRCAAPARS